MTTNNHLGWRIFFHLTGELDGLQREREKLTAIADRTARDYETALRKIDDRIAELKAAEAKDG